MCVIIFASLLMAIASNSCNTDDDFDNDKYTYIARCLTMYEGGIKDLERMGCAAFPYYSKILADNKLRNITAAIIFNVLMRIDGDRDQFRPIALTFLKEPANKNKHAALALLATIGKQEDCSAILAVITLKDSTDHPLAITAIAKLGGNSELTALQIMKDEYCSRSSDVLCRHFNNAIAEIDMRLRKGK